ncbi:MAG: ATP-binding protein [bacterium]|nr:ATP-binding protein [bacterium]
MILRRFLDRDDDKQRILSALSRPDCQFIVLYGRRRIGKSALIKHVLRKDRDIYFLSDQTSEQNQRRLFAQIVSERIEDFNRVIYPDWETLLRAMSKLLKERITVCWDEFPYMVKSCPELPSVLQKLLNLRLLNFDFILCGSSQQLMYNCVFNKQSPLYGLADEVMKLSPIPSRYMMEALNCDAVEAVKEYAIWGGIPRYWELRLDYENCESAIKKLLLHPQGILVEEPLRLLRDDMRDTIQSATLLSIIGNGANKLSEIASRAGKNANELTEPLKKLRDLGYVNREIPFNENERNSKKGLYFIHDNLFKFIYRFIAPNASILELGETNAVMNVVKTQMPSFVAECWENLCRNFVSGNEIDGILYNKSSRWWGKIFTEDVPKGEMVELDVVAESFDKQHVLIGECKWTTEEDAERILFRLQRIAKYLPFVKHRQVHFAIFAKSRPVHSKMARLFLPEDVLS